jgi:hypothetical protein
MRLRNPFAWRYITAEDQVPKWPAFRWNFDKPHRCPWCHAIYAERPSRWTIMRCCRCGVLIARFPRLWRVLPYRGIVCAEHTEDDPDWAASR